MRGQAGFRRCERGGPSPTEGAVGYGFYRLGDRVRFHPGMERTQLRQRQWFAGRFQLQFCLGAGTSAEVWCAFDRETSRRVALKKYHRQLRDRRYGWRRIRRELEVLQALYHPHVVNLLAADLHGDLPYLVFEYVEGETWRDAMVRRAKAGQRWPLSDLLPRFFEVVSAMSHAHRAGVVHRDLKPSNLLLTEDPPAAQVLDFGAAKMMDLAPSEQSTEGRVIGSLAYMAPEQWAGRPEPASDQFALGVLLYECLTLERAWHYAPRPAGPVELMERIRNAPRPRPSNTDPALGGFDDCVARALHPSADGRFADLEGFGDAVRQAWREHVLSAGDPTELRAAPTRVDPQPDPGSPAQATPLRDPEAPRAPGDTRVTVEPTGAPSASGPDPAEPVAVSVRQRSRRWGRAVALALAGIGLFGGGLGAGIIWSSADRPARGPVSKPDRVAPTEAPPEAALPADPQPGSFGPTPAVRAPQAATAPTVRSRAPEKAEADRLGGPAPPADAPASPARRAETPPRRRVARNRSSASGREPESAPAPPAAPHGGARSGLEGAMAQLRARPDDPEAMDRAVRLLDQALRDAPGGASLRSQLRNAQVLGDGRAVLDAYRTFMEAR